MALFLCGDGGARPARLGIPASAARRAWLITAVGVAALLAAAALALLRRAKKMGAA